MALKCRAANRLSRTRRGKNTYPSTRSKRKQKHAHVRMGVLAPGMLPLDVKQSRCYWKSNFQRAAGVESRNALEFHVSNAWPLSVSRAGG